ncbi:MAG: YdbL family protein [Hyphomonadaceae bacterium]|nr:YdbL family protein [Hyphomonadaceae bacterium]MBX3511735.1 YdbL family protein [Hyphomonadaceae bacterium]
MKRSHTLFALIAAGAMALTTAASAQQADAVLAEARASGAVGEQADGYLGIAPGASISADVRARVDQINIRRRAVYTQRASERDATVNEMAAAVACEIFDGRIAVGERYRDEAGQWRQRTASSPVVRPSFCPS